MTNRKLPHLEQDKAEVLEFLRNNKRENGFGVAQIWDKLFIPKQRIRDAINDLLKQNPSPIKITKPFVAYAKEIRTASQCAPRYSIAEEQVDGDMDNG